MLNPDVLKTLKALDLDVRLDVAAVDPEGFAQSCLELAQELDAADVDLEIVDPTTWRSSEQGPRQTGYIHQFRADVDSIQIMGREEEARHARRIEFARIRLGLARKLAGLTEDPDPLNSQAEVPALVQRRAEELHALRTELVERNLYLVLINVERYRQRAGASRMDLIQEGCVSLFRAVDGFDWRRGLLFRTYAVHWLNQAFRNYLYNNGQTVRVPVYLQKAIKHINRAADRLEDPLASHGAIAEEGELNETLVSAALTACRANFSIDADRSFGEDGSRLRDILVDETYTGPYSPEIEEVGLEAGLACALDQLSEREEYVVRMRFGIGKEREHTLAEVARILGVSVERIRQIQVRALCKMKTPGLRRDLEPYLN